MQGPGRFAASAWRGFGGMVRPERKQSLEVIAFSRRSGRDRAMRLLIEIAAATLLVFCITATSAAFAAGKAGRSADGLSCTFSVPANASPAARCAAIKRQCGGKFYA